MSKYNIGDKVRIISDLDPYKMYDGMDVTDYMLQYTSKIAIITVVTKDSKGRDRYRLNIDCGEWKWSDGMFEPVFTKKNLETGMIVECRDGTKGIVLVKDNMQTTYYGQQSIIILRVNNFTPGSHYNDDLTHVLTGSRDIMKVYRPCISSMVETAGDVSPDNLVWERNEYTELTLNQIAEKFGIDVKKLRIKD